MEVRAQKAASGKFQKKNFLVVSEMKSQNNTKKKRRKCGKEGGEE